MEQLKYYLFYKKYSIFGIEFVLFNLLVTIGFFYLMLFYPGIFIQVIILLIAIIFHEVAHGYVAYRFGDPTAKQMGRLNLNPLVHIDPIGSVLLPVMLILSGSGFLIGWAKPVPVQPRYFKNPLRDMMWVGAAGPLTNISIAIISSIIMKILFLFALPQNIFTAYLFGTLAYAVFINLVIAVFNLIPIPPLDGSRILMYFLPSDLQLKFERLERYGFIIIILLAYFEILGTILSFIIWPLLNFLGVPIQLIGIF